MQGEQDPGASRAPARRNEASRLISSSRLRTHINRLGNRLLNELGATGNSNSGITNNSSSDRSSGSSSSSSRRGGSVGPSSHPPQQHDARDPHLTNPASPSSATSPLHLPQSLYSHSKRRVRKRYMDQLIMNYLVIKGDKHVAECLTRESGAVPPVDLKTIEERMNVRKALIAGEVDAAMAHIAKCDPRLLEREQGLAFTLKLQKLVEMIRRRMEQREGGMEGEGADDDEVILSYAREELAPWGEAEEGGGGGKGENLQALEEAMTLLVFGTAAFGAAPGAKGGKEGRRGEEERGTGDLLDLSRRTATADRVNAAILQSQGQDSEPVLPRLLRKLRAAEDELASEMMC